MTMPAAAEALMNLSIPCWLDSPGLQGLNNSAHLQLEKKQ